MDSMVGFVGKRFSVVKVFGMKSDTIHAIQIEMNKQLILQTKRDLRFIDIGTGQVQNILQYEDDMALFKLVNNGKWFLIADSNISLYTFQNKEKIQQLAGHHHEVTYLKEDTINSLLLSAGNDCRILIQKWDGTLLRELILPKPIQTIECSVYQNLIVVATNEPEVLFYDYELGKLLSIVQLQENEEVSFLSLLTGINLLILGTNLGIIYTIRYIVKEQSSVLYDVCGVMNLNKNLPEQTSPSKQIKNNRRHSSFFDLTQKQGNFELVQLNYLESWYERDETLEYGIKQAIFKDKIYLATNFGRIICLNLSNLIELFEIKRNDHSNLRMNYNPYRQIREEYAKVREHVLADSFPVKQFIINNLKSIIITRTSLEFQAHKEFITCFGILQIEKICSCSIDGYVKIWDFSGANVASFNINHPLPITWKLKQDYEEKFRKQFFYAIKILRALQQQCTTEQERKILSLDNLLASLQNQSGQNKFNLIKENVILMRDEYSPRDLKYKNVKKIYRSEIAGPSLKEMEYNKRMEELLLQWKKETDVQHPVNRNAYEQHSIQSSLQNEKNDRNLIYSYFDQNYRDKIINPEQKYYQQSDYVSHLKHKLDNYKQIIQNRKSSIIASSSQGEIGHSNQKRQVHLHKKSEDFYTYAESRNILPSLSSTEVTTLSNSINASVRSNRKEMIKSIISTLNKNLKKSQETKKPNELQSNNQSLKFPKISSLTSRNNSSNNSELMTLVKERVREKISEKQPITAVSKIFDDFSEV